MKILVLGDIFAKYGRKLVINELPLIKQEYDIDFTIANCENAANGRGITRKSSNELLQAGINVLTSGNHIWDNRDVYNFIQEENRLLRPANYPNPCPGRGYEVYKSGQIRIGVINLQGTAFMSPIDNPFSKFNEIYDEIGQLCNIIIVDFHAEATAEKIAMGYHVDGKACAMFGTHTHVQTADERILDGGTGYITDVGMCGTMDGVIGVDKDYIVKRFLTFRSGKYALAEGRRQLSGVVFEFEEKNFKCVNVERIYKTF